MAVDLSRGACAGTADASYASRDPFYPKAKTGPTSEGVDWSTAEAVCRRCTIRDLCLQDALTEPVQWGYRAGMTPEQRQTLIKQNPLHPSPRKGTHLTIQQQQQRLAYYQQGMDDNAIAAAVGVAPGTIKGWRYAQQLESNHPTWRAKQREKASA